MNYSTNNRTSSVLNLVFVEGSRGGCESVLLIRWLLATEIRNSTYIIIMYYKIT